MQEIVTVKKLESMFSTCNGSLVLSIVVIFFLERVGLVQLELNNKDFRKFSSEAWQI